MVDLGVEANRPASCGSGAAIQWRSPNATKKISEASSVVSYAGLHVIFSFRG
jgi:hypothetical protein